MTCTKYCVPIVHSMNKFTCPQMLSSTNVDCVSVSSSLACNLLLSFCPSREVCACEHCVYLQAIACYYNRTICSDPTQNGIILEIVHIPS